MKKRFWKIIAEGRGNFPIDMLRFGECYPNTTVDAAGIEGEGGLTPRRKVELITYGPELAVERTCERFKSFMWKADYVGCE